MKLTFFSQNEQFEEYEKIFNDLIDATLSFLGYTFNPIVNVEIIDDIDMKELNNEYRHIDRTTDVLSLAYLEQEADREEIVHSARAYILGDMYISFETAQRQAEEYRHSLLREMSFLFVHGLLHLLGFDHQTEEQSKIMFQLQEQILESRGIKR